MGHFQHQLSVLSDASASGSGAGGGAALIQTLIAADGSLGWFKTYGSDKKDGFAKDGFLVKLTYSGGTYTNVGDFLPASHPRGFREVYDVKSIG